MIDSLVLNFTLQKHWRELTKDEPYKYYGLFFAHDENDGTDYLKHRTLCAETV